ncbi:MAG: sulfatase-like hydrolase/transferase [Deltaproteobacteria bacterium]|nr:sulfatase-like hydrolase/transferase [Deltaproteobacteria bacterium]
MDIRRLVTPVIPGAVVGLAISVLEIVVARSLAPPGRFFHDTPSVIWSAIFAAAGGGVLSAIGSKQRALSGAFLALWGLLLFHGTVWGARAVVAYFGYDSHLNPLSIPIFLVGAAATVGAILLARKTDNAAALGTALIVGAAGYVALTWWIQTTRHDDAIFRAHYRREMIHQAPPPVTQSPPDGTKNLIVLVLDTLRADALGVYGHPGGLTPHLDALAKRGVLFKRVVSESSWTRPSMGTLFTGLNSREHGCRHLFGVLDENLVTIPEIMRQRGLRTGAVVTNAILKGHFGFGQGFDFFVDQTKTDEASYWMTGRLPARMAGLTVGKQTRKVDDADLAVDRFLRWLPKNADGPPVFGWLHLFDTHSPYEPPEPFRSRLVPPDADKYEFTYDYDGADLARTNTKAGMTAYRSLYDAELAFADEQIGRFIQALQDRGFWKNTVLVFLADHGEQFREHGALLHANGLYQEEVHIPLIVAGAGVPEGQVVDTPVPLLAVPTALFDLAGLPRPKSLVGKGWEGLTHPSTTQAIVSEIDTEMHGRRVSDISVRRGPWKMILDMESREKELYNLDEDPGETHDLLAKDDEEENDAEAGETTPEQQARAERIKQIVRELDDHLSAYDAAYPRPPEIDPEAFTDAASRAALKSLGYIQ